MRATNSGISLTAADAAVVKGMLARGDRQHDIAAWFGVNGGRIAEVSTGASFANVTAQTENLPPPGPYISGKNASEAKQKLQELHSKIVDLAAEVQNEIDKL